VLFIHRHVRVSMAVDGVQGDSDKREVVEVDGRLMEKYVLTRNEWAEAGRVRDGEWAPER
jgi:predicted signal transduction protein with EAL and GGDEF domain